MGETQGMSETQGSGEALVTVSESAARRIAHLREQEGDPNLMLRVAVEGGGCSGFTYKFSFDASPQDDDLVIERESAAVLIDPISLTILAGSEIDYLDELVGSFFSVKNPNAIASCGCGASFSMG